MSKNNPMKKLDFFLGKWKLQYNIPKSRFSKKAKGEGRGEFKKILNGKYVTFEYQAKILKDEFAAQGIFAWDKQEKIYRYWWFEDSGAFDSATCNFVDDNTLCMNWQKSTFVQSFKKQANGNIILWMRSPINEKDYEVVLEVIFVKQD